MQSPDVNWYQVCKECYLCESSLLSELSRISIAGYTVNLLDEQQLRPFVKLPHRAELVHLLLTDILDKPLWLVFCSNLYSIYNSTYTKFLYWIYICDCILYIQRKKF